MNIIISNYKFEKKNTKYIEIIRKLDNNLNFSKFLINKN